MIICEIPEDNYNKMSSLGITDPNIISEAFNQNKGFFFDRELGPDGKGKPNALYEKLVKYFEEQSEPNPSDQALIHSMHSYTHNFSRSMPNKKRGEITVEEVVNYVAQLKKIAILKEENRRSAINNEEVFSVSFGAGTENELQIDDIAGYELYSVLTPLFAEFQTDDAVREKLQSEYRNLMNLEILSNSQKAQLDKLEKLLSNINEVLSWYKKLHQQIDDNQIFNSLIEEEPGETTKKSETFDKATVAQYDMASAKLKAVIYSMPLINAVAVTKENSITIEYIPKRSETFGLVMAGASKNNFNVISKLLEGITSYEEMYKILQENKEKFPQLEFLLRFIPEPDQSKLQPKDIPFINEFIGVFSLVETTPYIVNTSTTIVGDEQVTTSNLYSRMSNSTKQLMKELDQSLARNERRASKYLTDGKLDLLKLFSATGQSYGNTWSIKAVNKLKGITTEEIEGSLKNARVQAAAAEFLFALGFDEARYMANPNTAAGKRFIQYFSQPDNKNALTILFRKLTLNSENGNQLIENPLQFLMEDSGESLKNISQSDKSIVNIKASEMGIILNFFAELRPEKYSPTYFNGANELKYSKSEYFVLTQFANEMNKAFTMRDVFFNPNLAKFNFLNNPDIEGSQWLSRAFIYEEKRTVIEGTNQKQKVFRYFFPSTRQELLEMLEAKRYITAEQKAAPTIKLIQDALYGQMVDGKYTGKTSSGKTPFLNLFRRVSKFNIIDFTGMEELKVVMRQDTKDLRETTDGLLPPEKALQDIISFFSAQTIENVRFGDKTRTLGVMRTRPTFEKNRDTKYYIPFARTQEEMVFDPNSKVIDASFSGKGTVVNALTTSKILDNHISSEFQRIKNALVRISLGTKNASSSKTDTFGKNELRLFFGDFVVDAHKDAESKILELANRMEQAKDKSPEEIKAITKKVLEELSSLEKSYATSVKENFNSYIGREVSRLKKLLLEGAGTVQNLIRILNSKNFININAELEVKVRKAPEPKPTSSVTEAVVGMQEVSGEKAAPKVRKADVPITEENLDYLLSFFLKNGLIHNMEFFKFSAGSLANFDKTGEHFREVFKRILNMSSPGKIPNTSEFMGTALKNDDHSSAFSKLFGSQSSAQRWGELRSVIFEEVKTFNSDDWEAYKEAYGLSDEKHKPYVEGPKEADAQGISTIEFYRNYLMSTGSWDYATQEITYEKELEIARLLIELRTGEKTAEQIAAIKNEIYKIKSSITTPLPPLKLGYYGPSLDRADQTVYNKFSVKPMLPSEVAEFSDIYPMFEAMYKNGVDYYTFESGSKQANPKPVQPYYKVENGQKVMNTDFAAGVNKLNLFFLRELQYQAPKFKKQSILTSQGVKLLFSDLFRAGEVQGTEWFKSYVTYQQDKFSNSLEKLVNAASIELDDQLGIVRDEDGNYISLDETKLAEFIVKKEKENLSLRDYVKVTEDGKLKYNLDGVTGKKNFELKLLSHILKNVVQVKLHGDSLIQTSQTPYVGSRPSSAAEFLKDKGAIGTDAGLKFYRLVNGIIEPMEIMVAWDESKHGPLLELTYDGEKIKNKERPRDFLNTILASENPKDKAWVKAHARHFTYTGVRIPVQGPNSMESMRVKKFLSSSSGSSIILPAQIVTKSGGDYDIDKLTVYMPKLNRKGKVVKSAMSSAEYRQNQAKIRELRYELNMLLTQSSYLMPQALNSLEDPSAFYEVRRTLALIKNKGKSTRVPKTMKDSSFLNIDEFINYANSLIDTLEDLEAFEYGAGNEVIEVMSDMLAQAEMYDALITPNDSPNMKEKAESVPSPLIKATDVFSPVTSYRIFAENILARDALGIDAKINTMQKEFQKAGLKFESENPLIYEYHLPSHRTGNVISLGEIEFADEFGERISSILNEFVNGHVDVSKEDWIILLGMTDAVTPLAHTMLVQRTPLDHTLAFLRTPEVLEAIAGTRESLVFKRNKNSLQRHFLNFVDQGLESGEIKMFNPGLAKVLSRQVNPETGEKETALERLTRIVDVLSSYYKADLQEMFSTPENIGKIFNKSSIQDKIFGYMQLAVIEKQQQAIRALTSVVDWNTAKYESFASVFLTTKKIEELKNSFNSEAIDYLVNSKGKSSLAKFNILPVFKEVYEKIYPVIGNSELLNKFLASMKIFQVKEADQETFFNSLITNFIYAHGALFKSDSVRGNHSKYFYHPYKGIFSVTSDYNILRAYREFSEKYPKLVQSNYIAKNLELLTREDSSYFQAHLPIGESKDATEEKRRRDSLIELLNHHDPKVRQLFEDLLLGSYYQNIDKPFSPKNLHNLAPASLINPQESLNALGIADPNSPSYNMYVRMIGLVTKTGQNPYTLFAKYNSELTSDQSIPTVLESLKLTAGMQIYEKQMKQIYKKTPSPTNFKLLAPLGPNDASFVFTPANYGFGVTRIEEAPVSKPTAPSQSTINIYSTDKNGFEGLSNLLNGPVKATIDGVERTFKTVEHLYQVKKALFAGDKSAANQIFKSANGWDAQRLGGKKGVIKWTTTTPAQWDEISTQELDSAMRLAFEQNQSARDLLLKTGNAALTHKSKVNLGKWEKDFPDILMKIREELRGTQPTSKPNAANTPTESETKRTPIGKKIISDEDIAAYKAVIAKFTGWKPKRFFTANTKFSAFYNNDLGTRRTMPNDHTWILNKDGNYDMINLSSILHLFTEDKKDKSGAVVSKELPSTVMWEKDSSGTYTFYDTESGELLAEGIEIAVENVDLATGMQYPVMRAPVAEPVKDFKKSYAWEIPALETQDNLEKAMSGTKNKQKQREILQARLTRFNNMHAVLYERATPYDLSQMDLDARYDTGYELAEKILFSGSTNLGQLATGYYYLINYIPNIPDLDYMFDVDLSIAKFFKNGGRTKTDQIVDNLGIGQKDLQGMNLFYITKQGGTNLDEIPRVIMSEMGLDWVDEELKPRPAVTVDDVTRFIAENPNGPFSYINQFDSKAKAESMVKDYERTIKNLLGGYLPDMKQIESITYLGNPEIFPDQDINGCKSI
jgi:predicted NAD-dependent protein-ADP-ribosyltransferase YbiA (DUF1768 family)